ncbi:hypothetical protein PAPHI01_1299 [Pancytospora philotis]|nr:hypothetical protein PAPHI01_1299 [Pancytospora philotis]
MGASAEAQNKGTAGKGGDPAVSRDAEQAAGCGRAVYFQLKSFSSEISAVNRILYGPGSSVLPPVRQLSCAEMIANLDSAQADAQGIERAIEQKEEDLGVLLEQAGEIVRKCSAECEKD